MWVGSTSSALAAALGLSLKNGSMSTRVSPSISSKQAWPRKRISTSISFAFGVGVQFSGEFPPDGNANHHAHPRLLGQQRVDPGFALRGVGLRRGLTNLGTVGVAEPPALVQRMGQHELEMGSENGQRPFGAGEALGVGERLHGSLDLLVRDHPRALLRVKSGSARPSATPTSPPPRAAPMLADSSATDSSTSTMATTYTPSRSLSRSSPRRAA